MRGNNMNKVTLPRLADIRPRASGATDGGEHEGGIASRTIAPSDETLESLELLVGLVRELPRCLEACVFKLRRAPGRPTAPGLLACSPKSEPTPALIAAYFSTKQ